MFMSPWTVGFGLFPVEILVKLTWNAKRAENLGGNTFRPCTHGRGNYHNHNNYKYQQYYTHDDG